MTTATIVRFPIRADLDSARSAPLPTSSGLVLPGRAHKAIDFLRSHYQEGEYKTLLRRDPGSDGVDRLPERLTGIEVLNLTLLRKGETIEGLRAKITEEEKKPPTTVEVISRFVIQAAKDLDWKG